MSESIYSRGVAGSRGLSKKYGEMTFGDGSSNLYYAYMDRKHSQNPAVCILKERTSLLGSSLK